MSEKFELYEFQGHRVLFTPSRVRYLKEPLPEDIEIYEIRHSDEGFKACQLSRRIWVNHYGTFLSFGQIDLGEDFRIYFNEETDMHDLNQSVVKPQTLPIFFVSITAN